MKKQTLNPIAKLWLWLGMFALAAGGIYAIILVGARSPKVQDMLPFGDFFRTALIVHVNLTVLVWMLSITAMLWSQYAKSSFLISRYAALLTCAAGTVLMAISPFTSEGHPLLSNYVPILAQPVFLFGLSLFFFGMILQVTLTLFDKSAPDTIIPYGLKCVAVVTAISVLCFLLSGYTLRGSGLLPTDYYEHLFWAGGHTLQIAYTLVCLVAWLMLASAIGLKLQQTWLKLFLGVSVFIALFNPLIYGGWPPLTAEHRLFFTDQMKWGGGISVLLITYVLLRSVAKSRFPKPTAVRNALIASFLLFTAGGVIGHLISGVNVVIPAHYHGSIVGVSLALMGVVYLYVPVQGRLALLQPYLYGGGQLLHIAGLAWSGGYGTLRKTPGAAQSIEGQTAMGLMGFGGLLSIIGGLLFVILILRSLKKGI
jgi:hypothetical protein